MQWPLYIVKLTDTLQFDVATGASTPARQQGGTLEGMYANAFPTNTSGDTFSASAVQPARMSVMPAPAAGAAAEHMQEYVQYQLDSLGGNTLLNGLVLQQGQHSRLIGGMHNMLSLELLVSGVRVHDMYIVAER